MRTISVIKSFLVVSLMITIQQLKAQNTTPLFTGDQKLACEAIMCLSSSERPNECNESIQKYFTLPIRSFDNPAQIRKNFLNLCPTGNSAVVNQIIDLHVDNASKCTINAINRNPSNMKKVTYSICKIIPKYYGINKPEEVCTEYVTETNTMKLPPNCADYFDNMNLGLKRPTFNITSKKTIKAKNGNIEIINGHWKF